MKAYIHNLLHQHELIRCNPNAAAMKQYMRNQFEYYGLKSKDRRALGSAYMKSNPLPATVDFRKIVLELWKIPQRELQYFAIELMMKYKKQWVANDVDLIEFLITHKSWWDTVDYIANQIAGPFFKRFPELIKPVTKKWNRSENIWLQRMSILFQLKYKKETDLVLLTVYIHNLNTSTEFFVQKAIGWVLREYSKTDPKWVKAFVKENELMPLSKREALKWMLRKVD